MKFTYTNNYFYRKLREQYLRRLSDEELVKKVFRKRLNRELNLENPVKFNDKMQWMKLYWYDELAIKCADKYAVREYVKETIGEKYLNELYGAYDSTAEMDFNVLPEKFVLKATHGCAYNIICSNKNIINPKQIKKKLNRWLNTKYYYENREWVYKYIKPKIICEKYLSEKDDQNYLTDYKFYCFHGKVKLLLAKVIDNGVYKKHYYNLQWEKLDLIIKDEPGEEMTFTKPPQLKKMIALAEKLAKPFPFVRVDFYYIDNQIIFGEMTFFPNSGWGQMIPPEYELKLGNYLQLPNQKKGNGKNE